MHKCNECSGLGYWYEKDEKFEWQFKVCKECNGNGYTIGKSDK